MNVCHEFEKDGDLLIFSLVNYPYLEKFCMDLEKFCRGLELELE